MRRVTALLLALFTMPVSAITSSDFLFRTVGNDGGNGLELPYRIYVPAACAHRRCPLLVFLHGAGEQGSNNTAQLNNRANGAFQLPEAAEAIGEPMIMAAPQAPQWWSNDGPMGGVADMIDDIQGEFGFDPARLYVTGLSMGGGGTIGFLQRFDAAAAAAVPVCPAGVISSDIDRDRLAVMPTWFFHAGNDGTVTVGNSRTSVATLRAGGGDPIYTEFVSGGHGIWGQSYGIQRLVPWLLAQRWRAPMVATDPWLALTEPTPAPVLFTAAGSVPVAGSSGGPGVAVSRVDYQFGALSGMAAGTASFSAGPLNVPADAMTLLHVRATGSSFVAAYGGNTTFSRSVRVIHPVPANRLPNVALWLEPVAPVGRPLRLRALVDDDGQPLSTPTVSFQQIEGPVGDPLQVDPGNASLAWWTPSIPGLYRFRVRADDGAAVASAEAAVLVLADGAARPTQVAVNAGGGAYTSVEGIAFAADSGFIGGTATTLTTGLTTMIGSQDDVLHQSMRRGATVRHSVPVANGRHLVVLYLSEWRWFTQVSRAMDIRIQGETVLPAFDLYRWAGLRQAMRLGFVADVVDGVLEIEVARSTPTSGEARIDGFEILAVPAISDLIFSNGFDLSRQPAR